MVRIRQLRALIRRQTQSWMRNALVPGHPGSPLALRQPAQARLVTKTAAQAAHGADRPTVHVIRADMLTVAGTAARSANRGEKVAVLNMASANQPGGRVRTGAGAQEENLHRRSDLGRFLGQQRHELYPIPPATRLVSVDVTIFRGAEKDGYPIIDPFTIDVVSCAAVPRPELDWDRKYQHRGTEDAMRGQVEVLMDAAEQTRCTALILSAFGCGAYGNPPDVVADFFRRALQRRWSRLREVTLCIIDDHSAARWHNPRGNFTPFAETFRQYGRDAME